MNRKNSAERIGGWIIRVWHGIASHPVELLVLLHATAAAMLRGDQLWQYPAWYASFAAVAALCLSFHRSNVLAAVAYWLVLPLYALSALLPVEWHGTTEYWILTVLLPAVYLLSCGYRNFNARFFSMVRSLAVALGIGIVSWILLIVIEASIQYLFSVNWRYAEERIVEFCFVLLAPMVFIGMESDFTRYLRRATVLGLGSSRPIASRLEEALVNWVLTPALLIYNVVLYTYLVLIIIRWDLPKGSVATMVSIFIGVAVAVRWLRPMLKRQPLGWYFSLFGVLALPLVALFWVAAGYRISQYGLTIDRCILVAAGVLMTLFALLSLLKTSRGGYWFLVVYVLAGLVLAVGGPLSARQVALRSQTKVIKQYAEKLNILSDDGILALPSRDEADSAYRREHRAVYQAMKYIENDLADSNAVRQKFGVTRAEYLDHLSRKTADYADSWRVDRYDNYPEELEVEPVAKQIWVNPNKTIEIADIGGYSRLYSHISVSDGKIRLDDTIIEADSVLAVQLAKLGYTLESNLDRQTVENHEVELCTYHSPDGRILMVFEFFHIECDSVSNHMGYGEVLCALVKD